MSSCLMGERLVISGMERGEIRGSRIVCYNETVNFLKSAEGVGDGDMTSMSGSIDLRSCDLARAYDRER